MNTHVGLHVYINQITFVGNFSVGRLGGLVEYRDQGSPNSKMVDLFLPNTTLGLQTPATLILSYSHKFD